MRIDTAGWNDAGDLQLNVFGLEKQVEDARLRAPRIIESISGIATITELLSIVRYSSVSSTVSRDFPVPTITTERERWKYVDGDDASIARACGWEVYADPEGTFIIRDKPTLQDAPVWTVNAGENGVLVDYTASESREGVYTVVIAESDSLNQTYGINGVAEWIDPFTGVVGGELGEVVRFYNSALLTTIPQAEAAAQAILADSLGVQKNLSFTTVPHPALEPGDVVRVELPDGTVENHLIDSITHTPESEQSAQTRAGT
jgi:hypothetical protein